MKLKKLVEHVTNKENFLDIDSFINFSKCFLEFIKRNLQATIVSQNENAYIFYQYKADGNFQISRPINSSLMFTLEVFEKNTQQFNKAMKSIREIKKDDFETRNILINFIYTIQQSIGAALDSLPGRKSNTARKINGDLFERLIRLILNKIGVNAKADVIQIPVIIDDKEQFKMSYQHDLIVRDGEVIKLIGSVKTSSKDRLDKIFVDKFLYNKLTDTAVPHIAIFLNDVQRKNSKKENEYGINSTFLPGHFKGYTVKLNPLDGVYYFDIRPNMKTEKILKDHIRTFDKFICDEIWKFIR
jgi:hypothetical protein